MSLEPGTRLGVFEVLGPIGAGGMGEVYRARDTRLGRDVAIKVLPEIFARDPSRVARFEREARMLASINHPAIAAIYGAEESGDVRYIVMELVPGETLAERLLRGALPMEESLSFARQIAEALEAAHERGVIHRDLKPSNIKITPDGKVKVLDLGLAKAMEMPSPGEGLSDSPTITQEHTRPGTILGTAEFMSPEQARGKEVDKRTDIWAFGCILYETLSGRRAFAGETLSDVLAAILSREPDWKALPSDTPIRVRELLSRCLAKDASQRLRDIGDAKLILDDSFAETSGQRTSFPELSPRRARRWLLLAAAAAVAASIILLAVWARGRARRSVGLPNEKYLAVLPIRDLSGSPSGKLVGDGLAETLSVRLSKIPGIQVVTPAASAAAADRQPDPFAAGRSVGANLIVRATYQREGDRMRITYAVWKLPDRRQVAGEIVEGSASDIFGIQDRLAERVASSLRLPTAEPGRPTSPAMALNASDQEQYLQALGHLQRYDRRSSVDEAIRILERLAADRPASALVQAALGRAYLHRFADSRDRRSFEQAVEACGRAQRLDPELPDVDVTLGRLQSEGGQPAEGIAAFQRALSRQPNNYQALLGLAAAYGKAGRTADAESTYRRAIALQPSYWGGYSELAAFYASTGDYTRAAETFRRVTELTPDSSIAWSNLGAAYGLLGEFEKALATYKKSLALEPTDGAYSNTGTALFFLGRYRESAESFESAVRLTPGHFQLWANLGDAYRWTKGFESKAPQAYRRAIELAREELRVNPRNAQVLAYLALCLAKTDRAVEAEQHVREALLLEPSGPESLYSAAVVSTLGGRPAEALERLRRALDAGYPRVMVERDPELVRLRTEPGFRALFRGRSEKAS